MRITRHFINEILFTILIIVPVSVLAQGPVLAAPLLLRAKGDNNVFAVERDKKYLIKTAEIFNSYFYKWQEVKEVSLSELNNYPFFALISKVDDSKVYYIGKGGGEKRWIVSPEAFQANNFDWRAVRIVNDLDFTFYKNSKDITGDLLKENKSVTVEMVPVFDLNMPRGVDFSILWNVWKSLEDKYRDSGALDRQKMAQGAADGVVRSLGDPYTVFMAPKDAKRFTEDVSGSFGGIGAELGYKNGIVIIAPLKNMPAEKAGLQAGDRILEINGTSTADMRVEDAVSNIRGEKGVTVKLLIEREGAAKPMEFSIVRDIIKVPTLEWSKKTSDIGYLKIYNFFGAVEDDFVAAGKEMRADGVKKIILDLRNNPGGLLGASINIAGEFIPKGKLIVSQDFGTGKGKDDFYSSGGGLNDIPIVVLMNKGSASASEILAGALKDSKNAVLVGEKTFGKGSVQEVLQLSGGSTLKVTVASWIRPSGKSIDKEGIEPDVPVEITDTDRSIGRDPQLDKALGIINSL